MNIKKKILIKLSKEEALAVNVVCEMLHNISENCMGAEMKELNDDTNEVWNRIASYFIKWEEK